MFPDKLRIIPLGGVEEVGKNCLVFEYKNDILVVDLGLEFPNPDYPGVQYLLPDISYLKSNQKKIKALIVTHGHLDHIGGISYLIEDLGKPIIFGSKLTLALIKERLEEKKIIGVPIKEVDKESILHLGNFKVKFFHVNHNIPDSLGLLIETPVGKVIHTGDFKFDEDPYEELPAEKEKIKKYAKNDTLLLLSDSTNADSPGKTISEKKVGEILSLLIKKIQGRVIFTTFSTLISRLKQIIEICKKEQKKIVVFGLSLKKNLKIATELGYLKIPKGLFIEHQEMKKNPDHRLLVLATGSQGEERSALVKIAKGEFFDFKVKKGDTVIFSSSAIPGNELAISELMNDLIDKNAELVYEPILGLGIHSSGHASQTDLEEMIALVKPKFFIPVHGEHFMQAYHRDLAKKQGIKEENIFILRNGDVLEIDKNKNAHLAQKKLAQLCPAVEAERVIFLRKELFEERKKMAEEGVCFLKIRKNSIKIRFFGLQFEKKIRREIEKKALKLFQKYKRRADFEKRIETSLKDYIASKTGKKPIVIL